MPVGFIAVGHRERLVETLSASPGPLCDDCLSETAGVKPRQQVNQRARQLAAEGHIQRSPTECSQCGRYKLTNVLAHEEPRRSAASLPTTPRSKNGQALRPAGLSIMSTGAKTISLRLASGVFKFDRVPLLFEAGNVSDVFRFKNNKTLGETMGHPRYQHLKRAVLRDALPLDRPLGKLVYELKQRGDSFYKSFLNPYGDETFCSFAISDPSVLRSRGVYFFAIEDQVQYAGRCLDNFGKRINQGYGRIHPKNCYLDGQSTNCRLNSLVAEHRDVVSFYVCVLDAVSNTIQLEAEILESLSPPWNMQGV